MMRTTTVTLALAIGALMVGSAQQTPPAPTSPAGAGSQNRGPAVPQGPAPRLPNGKVDFGGVWQGGGPVGDIRMGLAKGETIPIRSEWQAIMDKRMSKEDPEANCLPTGVPRRDPYPWRILQTDTHTFFLFEGNIHSYRQIFLDGRPHLTDPDPTWYGHSIGHWEGDTLVVDTVGFNDKFWFGASGLPHTTQLHTVERFRRLDADTMSWDITINDPGAYAKPFTVQTRARYEPGWELMEYICQENETSASEGHIKGKANSNTANGGPTAR
jgi:hypothetical protein